VQDRKSILSSDTVRCTPVALVVFTACPEQTIVALLASYDHVYKKINT